MAWMKSRIASCALYDSGGGSFHPEGFVVPAQTVDAFGMV
jgi:hypothetical protein